jgi:hypothetical protein
LLFVQNDEAWEQVLAGRGLVTWSRLCAWDAAASRLLPTEEVAFEAGHEAVHPTLGRLLSWIAFGVGAEYIAKGACLLNGIDITASNRRASSERLTRRTTCNRG